MNHPARPSRHPRTSPAVLVICVNFHSEQVTRHFVGNLLSQRAAAGLQIIVVDNECNNGSGSSLRNLSSEDSQVRVLESEVNLGYFGGADYALSQHRLKEPLPDWVVVSNPDVEISNLDFFAQVVDLYSANPPGVVAPAIRSTISGTNQNPYLRHRPSRARMHFYKWVFRFRLAARGYQSASLVKLRLLRAVAALKGPIRQGVAPQAIYAPHGSFMLFHRSYFEAGGTFRHGTFLFGEEIFVAEAARRLGLAVVYDPRLVVAHQQSTHSKILRDTKLQIYAKDAAAFVANEFF